MTGPPSRGPGGHRATHDGRPGPELVRAIGRADLTALVVNAIVGSGIFGVPAVVLALVGGMSPVVVLVAGAGVGVVVLCMAEVASRFRSAGGPYVYARAAFGPFVGHQIGWITFLVRIASAAANANLFAIYAGELWPPAGGGPMRVGLVTVLIAILTTINVMGVRHGARMSTWVAVIKILPLVAFVLVGAWFVRADAFIMPPAGEPQWGRALLLLVFAYGGFEAAMIPLGEARDPKRDAPFALLVGVGAVTLLYVSVQIVVVGTLPVGADAERPLASAARAFLGSPGAIAFSLAALVSIYGWFSAAMLSAPRLTYALAEHGDIPRVFATVHPRFRTPWVSIAIFGGGAWVLALAAGFTYNAELSAVARLLTYIVTCAALIVFRRRDRDPPGFVAPGGIVLAAIAIAGCGLLAAAMGPTDLAVLAATFVLATGTWLWSRRGTT